MLTHLLYISSRNANRANTDIVDILASCQKNNLHTGITGVLLYSDTKFAQYVEGEYSQLISLYDKIKNDNRHSSVNLMSISPIENRLFPSWHMGNKKMSLTDIDYISEMSKDDKATFGNALAGSTEQGKKVQKILETLFK